MMLPERGAFPLVIGGDCSVLLGSLYGACAQGARGLIHIDGHSDFSHPGNYGTRSRLGSAAGIDNTAHSVIDCLKSRGLDRVWLHVDLDVLAQSVMPAVDSPGSPGLTFDQLGSLIARLYRSERVAGATITIYDPARDPENVYATPIATTLGEAFT